MKNKKLAVIALMLIAVLTLGIGYATLTDTLTILGTAEVTASGAEVGFDEKVYFSDARVTTGETSGGLTSTAVISDPDKVSLTANTLNSSDDIVTFVLTIKNDSDHDAKISINAKMLDDRDNKQNTNPTAFNISYDVDETQVVAKKGGTIDVTVTVQLTSGDVIPTSGSIAATFECELTATTQD